MPPSPQPPAPPPWTPTLVLWAEEPPYGTSMGTARVKTDASSAYLKGMGNRESPHCLANELVATALAEWFGLPTAEFAVIELTEEACQALPEVAHLRPGPAFVSRHVPGRVWGGSPADLRELVNPEAVTRLVVFDTWVRNCDRHDGKPGGRPPNLNNVYLATTDRPDARRLFAIDHSHCFDRGRDWTPRLGEIGYVRDGWTYGLFPEFVPLLDVAELIQCQTDLRSLGRDTVRGIVDRVPAAWDVPAAARAAMADLILGRAGWLADRIRDGWPLDLPGAAPSP